MVRTEVTLSNWKKHGITDISITLASENLRRRGRGTQNIKRKGCSFTAVVGKFLPKTLKDTNKVVA